MQPKDYACPICGARNMDVEIFDKAVLVEMDEDANLKYCQGTYYCPVCSKDGMITCIKKAKPDG